MSTRSIIVVTGSAMYNGKETFRLYKHCDGYPSGNLPLICAALTKHKSQVDSANEKWAESRFKLLPGAVAALIVGESASEYGVGASIEDNYGVIFEPEHLGNQWDLEWMYVVDLDSCTVKTYGGDFNQGPKGAYERGVKDPFSEVNSYYEEYKEPHRQEIRAAIEKIELLGFKVNPSPKRKPRSKIERAKMELKIVGGES